MIITSTENDEYYFHEGCFILELLNDPRDQETSIARARVCPGTQTKLHALKSTTERYLILEGSGTVELAEKTHEVKRGDVVVIAPEQPQRIANTGEVDLVFLAICTPRFVPECYIDLESQK